MDKCCNPSIGALLHAYELKTLRDEDVEKFELHLLDCDYCFNELSSFNEKAGMLLNDGQVKKEVQLQAGYNTQAEEKKSILNFLWPKSVPFYFRPAAAYAVAILAIVFAPLLRNPSFNSAIGPIQSIAFTQTRSTENVILDKNIADNGIVNFIVNNYTEDQTVNILIKSSSDKVIYEKSNYTDIDRMGIGRLYLPVNNLAAGQYNLEIVIESEQNPDRVLEYTFMIE